MAKRFGGFTPEQMGKIIPEMQGMQADEQAKFLAATPGAAARVGMMQEQAKARIGMAQGGYMKKSGYAVGGTVEEEEVQTKEDLIGSAITDPTKLVTKADVEKIDVTADQKLSADSGQLEGTAPTATVTEAGAVDTVAGPTKTDVVTVTPKLAAADVEEAVETTEAAQGTVGPDALADAASMDPTKLAALDLEAAQIKEAQKVVAPDARRVEDGELIEGSTVDMDRVKAETNFEAVTGAPSTDATVQGQLTSLMRDFEGTEPPAWAAGAMRQAAAIMSARGLSSSSMAGQAVVQAAMESALPIAQMDAQTFAKFESQNLSNKQQTAMFAAEKRAEFLGLEFNQEFQSRVANSAKISDIAKTVDMGNLSAANAKVMADAAAMSQVDLTNLNNRQQTQIQNAKSFLQMDMANLDNQQQTTLFKTQAIINSLFTDQAATNAAAQFNASSEMQTDQFFANLTSTVSMFNTEQSAARDRFNAGEANAMEQFNTSIVNQRDQFNAQNSLIVEQANAAWLQSVSTQDTAAQNLANRDQAMAASEMTSLAFNAMIQESRDLMSFAWQTEDSNANRATQLAVANMVSDDAKVAGAAAKSEAIWGAVGTFAAAAIRS